MNNTKELAKVLGKTPLEVVNDFKQAEKTLIESLRNLAELNEELKNLWLCNAYQCAEKPEVKDLEGGQWCDNHADKFINQGDNQT